MIRLLRAFVPLLALGLIATSCTTVESDPGVSPPTSGTIVRHIRVRLAPEDTMAFETRIAERRADPGEVHWRCYREPPGRYWIIYTAPTAAGARGMPAVDELFRLDELTWEIDWDLVMQQSRAWSTVEEIDLEATPKARIMSRHVKAGRSAEFDAALAARTKFLADHDYPLPIEGFVTLSGDRGRQFQFAFPRDWSSFHGSESFGAFVRSLSDAEQEGYARVKRALMVTMSNAAWYDGDYVAELSVPPSARSTEPPGR